MSIKNIQLLIVVGGEWYYQEVGGATFQPQGRHHLTNQWVAITNGTGAAGSWFNHRNWHGCKVTLYWSLWSHLLQPPPALSSPPPFFTGGHQSCGSVPVEMKHQPQGLSSWVGAWVGVWRGCGGALLDFFTPRMWNKYPEFEERFPRAFTIRTDHNAQLWLFVFGSKREKKKA